MTALGLSLAKLRRDADAHSQHPCCQDATCPACSRRCSGARRSSSPGPASRWQAGAVRSRPRAPARACCAARSGRRPMPGTPIRSWRGLFYEGDPSFPSLSTSVEPGDVAARSRPRVRLLLDSTCAALGSSSNQGKLRAATVDVVSRSGQRAVYFSAVSLWELAIKRAKGRLQLRRSRDARRHRGAALRRAADLTARHGLEAAALPPHHADPFDRMLIAQARLEGPDPGHQRSQFCAAIACC